MNVENLLDGAHGLLHGRVGEDEPLSRGEPYGAGGAEDKTPGKVLLRHQSSPE